MEMTSYDHGVHSWVDIGAPDIAAAADFYSALFGWDIPEGPEENGGYRIATLRGKTVAGIGPAMNPGPPFWASYVNVDSAQAIADAVPGLGGQVLMPPMEVMAAGTMAVFLDNIGAAFSVWQAGEHPGAGLVNEPGSFVWNELVSTDVPKSKEFYTALFGWTAETQGEDTPMPYTEWKLDGRSIGGMMPKPDMMPAEVPAFWGVYFSVDDCDATVARVTELGGSVIMPPMDIEPGRFAVVADPFGATFNVMKLSDALAAGN